jgi:predicted transposase YbfD/YdcC
LSVSHAPKPTTGHGDGIEVISALLTVFGGLIDPGSPRGIRHELASVLTITVLAVLAGAANFREAGDRAAELPPRLLAAAGARISPATGVPKPPSAATISRIVAGIDAAHADARVGAWLAECVTCRRQHRRGPPGLPDDVDWLDGLAIDGKVVRNSAAPGGVDVKLFSALTHREQVVIAQIAVPEHTTEVTCVPALLDPVDLTGKVITADAAHTCHDTADYLLNTRHADYALTEGNRPHLLEAIAAKMPRAVAGSAHHVQEDVERGRRVVREIWLAPADGIDFPGAQQVFRIRRSVYDLSGNRISKDIVHAITSLPTHRATAADLLTLARDHWLIEVNHWIRDVAWQEDNQHAYTGTAAHTMAILRNLALAILRLTGHQQTIRTLQRIAATAAGSCPSWRSSHYLPRPDDFAISLVSRPWPATGRVPVAPCRPPRPLKAT